MAIFPPNNVLRRAGPPKIFPSALCACLSRFFPIYRLPSGYTPSALCRRGRCVPSGCVQYHTERLHPLPVQPALCSHHPPLACRRWRGLASTPFAACVTRLNRVRLRYGSRVRLTRLRRRNYSRSPLDRLHVQRSIHMTDSFHSVRNSQALLGAPADTERTPRTPRRFMFAR